MPIDGVGEMFRHMFATPVAPNAPPKAPVQAGGGTATPLGDMLNLSVAAQMSTTSQPLPILPSNNAPAYTNLPPPAYNTSTAPVLLSTNTYSSPQGPAYTYTPPPSYNSRPDTYWPPQPNNSFLSALPQLFNNFWPPQQWGGNYAYNRISMPRLQVRDIPRIVLID